jgi:hypothetical protein
LGRKYAGDAIAAMKADGNSNLIALIIHDMIVDGVEQWQKKRALPAESRHHGLSDRNQRAARRGALAHDQ